MSDNSYAINVLSNSIRELTRAINKLESNPVVRARFNQEEDRRVEALQKRAKESTPREEEKKEEQESRVIGYMYRCDSCGQTSFLSKAAARRFCPICGPGTITPVRIYPVLPEMVFGYEGLGGVIDDGGTEL